MRWVSPAWLAGRLDGDLTILDTQPNVHDYIIQHIPGAVRFGEGLIHAPVNGRPGQYVSAAAFERTVRQVGVSRDRPVVVYTGKGAFKGWGDGLEQTAVAYALAKFGHPDIYILDGGLERWMAAGHPVIKAYPAVDAGDFVAVPQPGLSLSYQAFDVIRDEPGTLVLDARPAKPYRGQSMWPLPGHIPGAINVPWDLFFAPGDPRTLRSRDEIRAIAGTHGLTPEKTVVCSCGTGRKATLVFLILKYDLGLPDVRLYEGSFTEWSSYPDNATVTGPDAR